MRGRSSHFGGVAACAAVGWQRACVKGKVCAGVFSSANGASEGKNTRELGWNDSKSASTQLSAVLARGELFVALRAGTEMTTFGKTKKKRKKKKKKRRKKRKQNPIDKAAQRKPPSAACIQPTANTIKNNGK